MIEPYFGLTRTAYLQTLANRFGDFEVSWNWHDENDNEWKFTKRRHVIKLWEEDKGRLEKVQHRRCMPHELFVELDDDEPIANMKMDYVVAWCKTYNKEYAVYKSRKGYHISVLFHRLTEKKRTELVRHFQSDKSYASKKATWSMEWTSHWKQPNFIIKLIDVSKNYEKMLLGDS